ncbi:hypothetical protein [Nocardia sp. NPDC005745]|uniref:hypothetical protein n=1 Tax=Nocardia sp. NPDC005745 TaxID=3157061 RepID=UPI0033DC6D83
MAYASRGWQPRAATEAAIDVCPARRTSANAGSSVRHGSGVVGAGDKDHGAPLVTWYVGRVSVIRRRTRSLCGADVHHRLGDRGAATSSGPSTTTSADKRAAACLFAHFPLG